MSAVLLKNPPNGRTFISPAARMKESTHKSGAQMSESCMVLVSPS